MSATLEKAKAILLLLFILPFGVQQISAQTITGKVIDSKQQPIEGATAVLLTMDSIHIDASISGVDGTFTLNKQPKEYRLIIQHLSYKTKQVENRGADVGVIVLEPTDYTLADIVIQAERPFVKVEGGRLGYNLTQLASGKAVNNVYEALTKLPGVQEAKEGLTLAGARDLTLLLNGKPTTMSAAQLETLLRNTPIDRVDKAEVMYSAPPQYHVRGAVINVVMKRSDNYAFQGEVTANYTNRYYNSGGTTGNFRLSTPKMAFDIMYGASNVQNMEYMETYSKHTLSNGVFEINQHNRISSNYWEHNLRGGFEYNVNEKSNVTLSYTGSFTPNQHNRSLTTGNYQTSNNDKYIDSRMHNASLQYRTGFGLDVGGDYTYYASGNNQNLHVDYQNGKQASLLLAAGQTINRYALYADQNHSLDKGWTVGYGATYKFAHDTDYQLYSHVVGDIHPQNTDSELNEQTANLYASVGKSNNTGLSFSLSATGEYYAIGNYHKWAIYPQASFTFQQTPKHIFQLSLSTNKTFPSYWNMQSSVSYIDGYTELWGTPGLRPMTTYNLNGSYLLKQKYIFGLFFMHTSDYFAQTAYQSTDRLALIYQNINWNYMQLWGANVVLPFKVSSWLDARVTLVGMQMHQRCDNFFDLSFDRTKWMFNGTLDNTFKVTKNLAFELNGSVHTPAIQGTFDVKSVFNLTAGIKWSFAKERMILSARCSDILETGVPNINIRFKGQHLDMDNAYYSRALTINFIYRFGGYKQKEVKGIDTSRFGM